MQISSFMVTNGGPHPADKWAEVTTNTIVDTILVDGKPDDDSPNATAMRLAKRNLRNTLFDICLKHHSDVQQIERNDKPLTAVDAAAKAIAPLDTAPHLDQTMTAANAAFAATPFKDHFAKPEVQAVVKHILGQHTADVMHIERRWHHDRLTKGA
jgi:hypothetical protein